MPPSKLSLPGRAELQKLVLPFLPLGTLGGSALALVGANATGVLMSLLLEAGPAQRLYIINSVLSGWWYWMLKTHAACTAQPKAVT